MYDDIYTTKRRQTLPISVNQIATKSIAGIERVSTLCGVKGTRGGQYLLVYVSIVESDSALSPSAPTLKPFRILIISLFGVLINTYMKLICQNENISSDE